MARAAVCAMLALAGCGARTGLVVDGAGAAVADATTDATSCDFGDVAGDVRGAMRMWNGGAPLPAGRYRVTYVDGCMKYAAEQGWTVNAYAGAPDSWVVVGPGVAPTTVPPGTVGYAPGAGAFAAFDDCVAANHRDAPLELDFGGGPLGVRLIDSPYTDNVDGVDGRSPTWRLTCAPR